MNKINISQKTKKFLALISVVAITVGYLTFTAEADSETALAKNVKVTPLTSMEMTDELSFASTVEGKKETLLAAKMTGRIKVINADIGDSVKSGFLVAQLEADDMLAQQSAAAVARANAASTLHSTNNFFSQKLNDVRLGFKTAQQNLENLKVTIENETKIASERETEAEINVDMARTAKEDLIKTLDQQEINLYQGLETTVTQATILSNSALSYIYSINDRTYTTGVSEFNISANFNASGGYNNEARLSVLKFTYAANKLEDYYNTKIKYSSPDSATLLEARLLAVDTLNKGKEALQKLNTVVDDSSAGAYMTEVSLGTVKSNIINYGSQLESMLLSQQNGIPTGLIGTEQALNNLKTEKENKILELEQQINLGTQKGKLLKTNNASTQGELDNRYKLAQLQIEQQEQAIATEKAQAALQMQIAKAQFNSAGAALRVASVSANNSKLVAPYSSVVAEKYFDEGSVVNAGTPIFKVADISSLKLVIFVPESQIHLIKIGDQGLATSQIYPDKQFNAIVERISPQVDQDSKKVRVELKLDDSEKILKLGMFLNLTIKTEKKPKNVLAAPLKAVQTVYDQSYVFVGENGTVIRKTVKTGAIKEDYIEITEGLSENDQIIYEGFNNLQDGDKYVVQQ